MCFKTYIGFIFIMWLRHTEMTGLTETTVMKEGVYMHKSPETGGTAQHASHLGKLQGPSAGGR